MLKGGDIRRVHGSDRALQLRDDAQGGIPPRQQRARRRLPIQRARIRAGWAAPAARTGRHACKSAASCVAGGVQCFSYSNDASLLLPSTALTGNYRVTGWHDDLRHGRVHVDHRPRRRHDRDGEDVGERGASSPAPASPPSPPARPAPIRSTAATCCSWRRATPAPLGGSDVDPTGTLIKADKPVAGHRRRLTARPIRRAPAPATTSRSRCSPPRRWASTTSCRRRRRPTALSSATPCASSATSTAPTSPINPAVTGAPATINAGQVVDIGPTTTDFEVTGDHEFAVETIQQGGSVVDPNAPAHHAARRSVAEPVLRRRAVPHRRTCSSRRATTTSATSSSSRRRRRTLVLDGAAVTVTPTPIGSSTFGTFRVPITAGSASARTR